MKRFRIKNKYFKIFLKVAISLVFLVWVAYKTDWADFMYYLRIIKFWQLGAYVAVLIIGMGISSYKWKMLADYKKIDLPHWEFFKLYLAGTFINNFMPSFVAGDAYKAYEIAGPEKKYSEAASTVMMDRITGLVGAMILALSFSLLNIKTVIEHNILIWINILIILSLSFDIVITQLKKITRLREWVFGMLPEKIICFLRDLYSYNNNSNVILKSIGLSFLFSVVGIAFLNYILFLSLGIKIGVIDYLSVIFLISIISSLPISINNIGLKEWSYITFFGIFGLSSGAVIAASIISRFLQMVVSFAALPIYLKSQNGIRRT